VVDQVWLVEVVNLLVAVGLPLLVLPLLVEDVRAAGLDLGHLAILEVLEAAVLDLRVVVVLVGLELVVKVIMELQALQTAAVVVVKILVVVDAVVDLVFLLDRLMSLLGVTLEAAVQVVVAQEMADKELVVVEMGVMEVAVL
jgi:hypothetical protein